MVIEWNNQSNICQQILFVALLHPKGTYIEEFYPPITLEADHSYGYENLHPQISEFSCSVLLHLENNTELNFILENS